MKVPKGVARKDMLMVPVKMIIVNDDENYTKANRGDIHGLADSIAESGMKNPIVCRRDKDGRFVLRSGYRRMLAVDIINTNANDRYGVKVEKVPVILEDRYANEADIAINQLLENAHRVDAPPYDKAMAYKKLIDVHGLNEAEIARRTGDKLATVRRYLSLLSASQPVRRALEDGSIGVTGAADIVKRYPEDREAQEKALKTSIQASGGKRATIKATRTATRVRNVRQKVRNLKANLDAKQRIEEFMKSNKLSEKVQSKWSGMLEYNTWVLGGPAPWE